MEMIKKTIRAIITYIAVFFVFSIVEAFVLPVDYFTTSNNPLYFLLIFALFMTVVLIYVRKAENVYYYIAYFILFMVSVYIYKIVTSRFS
jgi:hypothetical protein